VFILVNPWQIFVTERSLGCLFRVGLQNLSCGDVDSIDDEIAHVLASAIDPPALLRESRSRPSALIFSSIASNDRSPYTGSNAPMGILRSGPCDYAPPPIRLAADVGTAVPAEAGTAAAANAQLTAFKNVLRSACSESASTGDPVPCEMPSAIRFSFSRTSVFVAVRKFLQVLSLHCVPTVAQIEYEIPGILMSRERRGGKDARVKRPAKAVDTSADLFL
jgi:hypothetical protein